LECVGTGARLERAPTQAHRACRFHLPRRIQNLLPTFNTARASNHHHLRTADDALIGLADAYLRTLWLGFESGEFVGSQDAHDAVNAGGLLNGAAFLLAI